MYGLLYVLMSSKPNACLFLPRIIKTTEITKPYTLLFGNDFLNTRFRLDRTWFRSVGHVTGSRLRPESRHHRVLGTNNQGRNRNPELWWSVAPIPTMPLGRQTVPEVLHWGQRGELLRTSLVTFAFRLFPMIYIYI